ncbi:hypothetical protein CAPTEDRAFT_219912 [Capitella teleta]|uniref:Protein FAM114A2 n=1 Tax=Capitella teleta TaxID=283909 RepID=R7T574_CAPTE|nr:hypothetical protein CAPTEDRAFT_219912 [Capitella teleta]|eukprot:ELT88444.1 hypothetical protein CAPTEDRAFT_219912 [Capitella teleta]
MSASDDDFQFENVEEDDLVAVTKKQSSTEDVERDMKAVSLQDAHPPSPAKSPAEIRDQLAKEEVGQEVTEEKKQSVLQKLQDADQSAASGGWGWKGLGNVGSNLLSTATSSVSTLTHSFGEGFDKFVETVEYSLGAEDPEEFAKREYADVPKSKEGVVTDQVAPASKEEPIATVDSVDESDEGWFGGWGMKGINTVVQGTTSAVKKTGSLGKNLVTGGLGVLETIGKKTYNVLAEGDHGLKSTIQGSRQKSSLSQMLREAKEKAKQQSQQDEEYEETRKAHFGAQFDDFQGLVQLEALEMLSNQCEGRVQSVLATFDPEVLEVLKKELVSIKDVFELKDLDEDDEDEDRDHEFDRLMNEYIGQVGLTVTAERIINVQEKMRKWIMENSQELEEGTHRPPKEIHEFAIQFLAQITACSIEMFHKIGQLLLTEKNAPLTSYKNKANGLACATRVLCTEVGIVATKFSQRLNAAAAVTEESDFVNALITNVYLEATNSSTYIQDGFQLLLPVLQQSAIEAHSAK